MSNQIDVVKFIKKSNDLVEARYKFDIWETRIFTKTLTMIKQNDEDFKEYTIFLKEIIDDFSLDKDNSAYSHLRTGARKLMKKTFLLPYETKGAIRMIEVPIITKIDSFDRLIDGGNSNKKEHEYIKVSFHPDMKPYLLQLKTQFTLYDVRNILRLPSTYSIRIYELLKQYEKIEKRGFLLEELKEILGVGDQYPNYGNFRQRVILKAQQDLKKHTDIYFEFEPIKQGRGVHKLLFYIYKNEPSNPASRKKQRVNKMLKPEAKQISPPTKNTPLFEELYPTIKEWVTSSKFEKWLATYPEQQVRKGITYTLSQLKTGKKIANIGGYLFAMIKETDLQDPVQHKKRIETVKKQKFQEQENQKQQLEQQLDELRNQLYQEKFATMENLFNDSPKLKQLVMDAAKNKHGRSYDHKLSDAENYQHNKLFRVSVLSCAEQLFADKFSSIKDKFEPKIEDLKKRIKN